MPDMSLCSCERACKTREEMRQRHGTPDQVIDRLLSMAGTIGSETMGHAIANYCRDWAFVGANRSK